MRFSVLGPVLVSDGTVTLDVGGAKQRTVLAMLIAHAGEPVSADLLVEAVYGDEAHDRARRTIQTYVSNLRGVLGDVIEKKAGGWFLRVDREAVDALRFEDLHRSVDPTTDSPQEVSERLGEALGLWRGRPYSDVEAHGLLEAEINRLSELKLAALAARVDADLARGFHAELVGEIETVLAEHPFQERFRAQHMLALYRAGRQKDALASYQQMRELLATELGIDPSPQLQDLEQQILEQDESLEVTDPLTPLADIPNNLPREMTSLVGREDELAEIGKLLSQHRLVTLTGAGGSGKTRLALQAARERFLDFPDGVWFVDLTNIGDSRGVATAVQSTLRIKPMGEQTPLEAVIDALQDRCLLIVLDNCEQVIDGAAELEHRLAQETDGVVVLATSRQTVGLIGEVVYQVPPLPVPPPPPLDIDFADLLNFDSVWLFCERAGDAGVDLDLSTHGNELAEVCRQVAGLPLALELAAGRLSVLSPRELAEGLTDQLRLLRMDLRAGDLRHATLEGTIDWSWQLLTESEQCLLARLAVFRGGWSLEAAEGVCAAAPIQTSDVFEILSTLVTRSLVVREPGSDETTRYSLLEPMRQFAEKRLGPEELAETKERHAAHFQTFASEKGASPFTHEGFKWFSEELPKLELDQPNMVAAVEFSLDHSRYQRAVEIIVWGLFYIFRLAGGHFDQVARWTNRLVAAGDEADPRSLVEALRVSGAMASASGRNQAWLEYMTIGLDIASAIEDEETELEFLQWAGEAMSRLGRFEEARENFDEVRSRAQDPFLKASAALSLAKGMRGKSVARWQMAQEALTLPNAETWAASRGYTPEVAAYFIAQVAQSTGHYDVASRFFERSRKLSKAIGFRVVQALSAARFGELLATRGQFEDAVSVLSQAFAVARELYWSSLVSFHVLEAASEIYRRSGDLGQAHHYASRARTEGYLPAEGYGVRQLACVLRDQGKLEEAEALYGHAIELLQQDGPVDPDWVPHLNMDLASIAVRKDRPAESIALIEGLFEAGVDLEYPYFLETLETLGVALVAAENPKLAARVLGSVDQKRRELGVVVAVPERRLLNEALRQGRAALGDVAWDETFEWGRMLGVEFVAEESLGQTLS